MNAPTSYGRSGLIVFASALLLAACSSGEGAGKQQGGGRRGPSGPPQVGYVVVQPSSVPVTTELAGRVTPYQMSQVRPQVAGIVQRRLFKEGEVVRQGQTLYQIDPSLYQASVAQAQANLQNAQATLEAARIRADRYKPLAQMQAVSQQDYTDAVAQARQAAAQVAQFRAALQTAQINLRFTRVPAPITGRIGRSLFTEGALVTANQADPLAVIERLDPIFVDIQQSSADMLALRRALARGGTAPATATVRLKLEDGSDYGATGTVEFTEVIVNESTGTVTLRARFPNAQNILLPGMFVRAVFAQAIDTQAYLVPQAGVSRDPKGNATVYVVGPGNKAVARTVVADRTIGQNWVITQGLAPGDKVIVQGTANLKPDIDIKPVPANTPQKIEPPKKGQGQGGAQTKGGSQAKAG
ncbi:efflux RND transporter periplasmic adaptor subunit [Sphingomonas sp. ABOLD]|uniref:Membrane fusion protein (Multidrug efflux system) n=1 Tax=Sphingomonas trueperi TaxID=53317 RepID=A0A7X5Y020_9SPHN|nr:MULTISPECIES: efflux RND transporter periplasmic adaptor subunit [Sphingomonas]NJB98143.1 membrane fusion protein (multidrug efflux system) [Sphingomonas trueperi]RSV42310.1 efflux RND transporter periplasmic adaptor subunit [Sphingomonas sp. ABOLE]RSV46377.1 efflux RND transporter periplasmic adaptor subunit [Sphingomonas sp. ABOLD]